MGVIKQPSREVKVAGIYEPIQALTGDSTGTTITNYGITTILVGGSTEGTAVNLTYTLATPDLAGAHKVLAVDNNSTKEIAITTANKFFGTTKETVTWSTGSTAPPGHVNLIAQSTRWMITNLSSTGIALS
jgi:hypothetical protein